jgi:putative serine protease PepD
VSGGVAKGSGAILDDKGHIVTNNHVISGAKQIQVTLANGQMYTAQVVGADTTTDLAVIKLDNPPSDLKPVEFADSDSLAVGQGVMAIGNPLGYDDTATTGIVSALNRPVSVADDNGNAEIVTNAIQIDAAINPGNSGGPTFDAAGKVIGINSSIASTATSSSEAGSIGIGFAIPANLVKRVSQEIIDNGSVKHVQLGVTITDGTAEADGVTRGGAKVASVVSGSPADKAGLKIGDTIVAFNDHAVNNTYSLLGYVRASASERQGEAHHRARFQSRRRRRDAGPAGDLLPPDPSRAAATAARTTMAATITTMVTAAAMVTVTVIVVTATTVSPTRSACGK